MMEKLNTEILNEEIIGSAEDYIKESDISDIVKDKFQCWDGDLSKHRSIRICMSCRKPFYGVRDQFFCPSCAEDRKINKPAMKMTCKDCGIMFLAHSANAKRCAKCAEAEKQEAHMRYRANGIQRAIGSTDKCVLCGKEYTVTSSSQRYCSSECRNIAYRPKKNEHAREYRRTCETRKRRKQVINLCVYCLQPFKNHTASNTCSDYCHAQHKKLKWHESRIRNGKSNMYKKLVEERNLYREQVQNDEVKKAKMPS